MIFHKNYYLYDVFPIRVPVPISIKKSVKEVSRQDELLCDR